MSDRKLQLQQLFAPAMEAIRMGEFWIDNEVSAVDTSRHKEDFLYHRIKDSRDLGQLHPELLKIVHNGYEPEDVSTLKKIGREQARVDPQKDFFYPLKETEIGLFQKFCIYRDDKEGLHKALSALAGAVKEVTGHEFEKEPYIILRNTNPHIEHDARDLVYVLPLTQAGMNILVKVQPQLLADLVELKLNAQNSFWRNFVKDVPDCIRPENIKAIDTRFTGDFADLIIAREAEVPGSVKKTSGTKAVLDSADVRAAFKGALKR